jgi:hypothetical protein
MPPKRPHSPELLSPSKRRRIQSWLDPTARPQPSIESAIAASLSTASLPENLDGASEISRSVSPAAQSESSGTGCTQAYNTAYDIIALRERGIVAAELAEKPTNWEDIGNLFAARRDSPEPTVEEFQAFEEDIHVLVVERR